MKKTCFLLIATIAVISMVLFPSCKSEDEKEIDKAIATYCQDINFPCIQSTGIILTKIARDGKYVVLSYELDENVMSVGDIRLKSESLKSQMIQSIRYDELPSFAKSKGYGIKYSYKGLATKDTFVLTIEASEL